MQLPEYYHTLTYLDKRLGLLQGLVLTFIEAVYLYSTSIASFMEIRLEIIIYKKLVTLYDFLQQNRFVTIKIHN